MTNNQIAGKLIHVAAQLVKGNYLPSDLVDDYPCKRYGAATVARMMEKAHDENKRLAYEVGRLARMITP